MASPSLSGRSASAADVRTLLGHSDDSIGSGQMDGELVFFYFFSSASFLFLILTSSFSVSTPSILIITTSCTLFLSQR
jgi:hypothetical protein